MQKAIVTITILIVALAGVVFFASRQTSIKLATNNVQRTTHTPPPAPPQRGVGLATSSAVSRQLSVSNLLKAAITDPAGSGSLQDEQNILIAGLPGAGNPAPNLTDTILVAHITPHPQKVFLFSLPRDLLVQAPDAMYYTKLNGLYERGGITALRLTAEAITGLEISRYCVVDITALRKVVDALGGVSVYVEKDIYDPRFPASNFGYETFELQQGWRYMDGRTATHYARTRNDREGDFGRMRRQQLLLEAIKQKVTGLSFVWDISTFLKIFDSVQNHVQTNFTMDELLRLFRWSRTLRNDEVTLAPLDADTEKELFTTGTFWFGDARADIVKPLEGIERYAGIHQYIQSVVVREN